MSLSRRNFLQGSALAASAVVGVAALASPAKVFASEQKEMGAINAIMTRRSIRSFTDKPVTDAQIETIMRAAMAAPSAYNEQPWEFIVVDDKAKLEAISKINKYALFAKNAPIGILTCVDYNKVKHQDQRDYGIIDVSIATQNILLAVHALGLGATWTGIYPNKALVAPFAKEFNLPEHIIPLAFVPIGYPKSIPKQKDHFKPERIRKNDWK